MNIQNISSRIMPLAANTCPVKDRFVAFKGTETDKVEFQNKDNKATAETKMIAEIQKTIDGLNLKADQPVKIKASSEYIPYVNLMSREIYKKYNNLLEQEKSKNNGFEEKGLSRVEIEIVDEKLEKLRQDYKAPKFEWKEKRDAQLKDQNAIFLDFNKNNNPYKSAGLTPQETKEVIGTIKPDIPKETQKKLKINPEEVVDVLLNLKKGQPIDIQAEREHEDNVCDLVKYIYETKGPVPVNVTFTERTPNNFTRTMLENASEKVLETIPQYFVERYQEILDKNSARLLLEGGDPNRYAGISQKRITPYSVAVGKAIMTINDRLRFECPWNVYYAPAAALAATSYPECNGDELKALDMAADDARKINRVGKFKEHTQNLRRVLNGLNKLVTEEGLNTIHFVSLDPKTGKPDGKTDLNVGLSEKSRFSGAIEKTPSGQEFMPNTPTEEVFSTPDKTMTNGVVSASMPLCLNGNIVEGIKMEFKDGKIVNVSADTNENIIREHIKMHENADMLGEVALVAGSPIFDLGRVFNSTLLDENAACHIALGSAYSCCIEGADSIKDPNQRKEYLNKYNVNESTTHNDFMIGSPNVMVEGITKDGKKITLIKDNKFQI
jgi:aminopeptidase